ncbi:Protein FAM189B [Pteropus alecto]|uniref:Protein FAM189B n=1 Tax=Pteropus alecto TaxID=9402 RepID=L5JWC6_PTEAL|nr:Protein FAM189B [Pteropus alecto]
MMPSPSDSSRSLTSRPSTRGLTHLRLHRPWLQALLTLGLAQVLLGILVVTFSMVASSVTTTESIKRSCPSWAGFSISFFSLLSVLCVMLSMAGSVLSCKNAQLARDFRDCSMEGKVCVCCPPVPLLRPCPDSGQELKVAPNSTCDEARGALKNLLFSVCGLTICAAIICTLSAIACCIQIFSLDLVHTQLAPERSVSGPLGPLGCASSPPAPLLHTMLDLEEFVPPVPPPPYYPPEYTCSSETDAQSITYNGSMDSPVPLYPTDCPPSYEAVMGLRGDSQATLFDPQLHDGSCIYERVSSVIDVSMDSGSLVLSAVGDPPGGSSPSEDSCLLELQGSVRSVDYHCSRLKEGGLFFEPNSTAPSLGRVRASGLTCKTGVAIAQPQVPEECHRAVESLARHGGCSRPPLRAGRARSRLGTRRPQPVLAHCPTRGHRRCPLLGGGVQGL